MMNPDLDLLHPYPFEKLNALKAGVKPADKAHIALSIGEPKHPAPQLVLDALQANLDKLSVYPKTAGITELRQAICDWATRRFKLAPNSLTPENHVLPVNGTREALFAFVQASIDRRNPGLVLSPNPFYQIYEGAAFLAGAEPCFIPCLKDKHYLPDFSQITESTWEQCQVLFLCSPGNPTGAVIPLQQLQQLIELADQHDFIIAADECYSEIYFDEHNPPTGLLEACAKLGRQDYKRCVVFHSLSKRSNLPGLRSGFVAGDADILKRFLLYRTYHGCAMPEQVQWASIAAWQDEQHVIANRAAYKEKFDRVLQILDGCLDVDYPDASFYLWPKLPESDESFAKALFAEQHITVLPGSYLSRTANGINPGAKHVRIALVASIEECIEAAQRIKTFVAQRY